MVTFCTELGVSARVGTNEAALVYGNFLYGTIGVSARVDDQETSSVTAIPLYRMIPSSSWNSILASS